MNLVENIKNRVKVLLGDIGYVVGELAKPTSWLSMSGFERNLGLLRDLVKRVAMCVELSATDIRSEANEIATSAEKRAAAITAIDELIPLPPLFEWVDNLLVPPLVDAIVGAINGEYGKDWGLKSVADIRTKLEAAGK